MRVRFWKRGHGIHAQELTLVDKFECNHAITTFQYGNSPMRVYAMCGQHKQFMLLGWSDPRARFSNRVIHSIPFIYSAALAFAAIGFIAYVLYYYLLHH